MSISVFELNISSKIEIYKCVELGVGSYRGFWPNRSWLGLSTSNDMWTSSKTNDLI
jgi:hypothetical protein